MSKPAVRVLIVATGVALIATQSLGLFGGGSPTVLSPAAFPLTALALSGIPQWLVPVLWGGVFLAWNPGSLRGAATIPARTVALWLVVAILSGAYFAEGWHAGLRYEGLLFVWMTLVLNILLFGLCSAWLWRAQVRPSFSRSVILHASLFVWMSTYAFPYLGGPFGGL